MKMTKRTEEKLKAGIAKFQKILLAADDPNESDTVAIITDILADVFGYDKYKEITSELAIRGTYCDLAIRIGEGLDRDKYKYLIECKAMGVALKENHTRQAVGYGAKKGIEWIVLTNGKEWRIYHLRFAQPLTEELVASFDLMTVDLKDEHDLEKLFLLTKEGVEKNARSEFFAKTQCINRFICSQLILSDVCVSMLRREFRKLAGGIMVGEDEVREMLRREVLKQDVLQGEESVAAASRVNRFYRAAQRKAEKSSAQKLAAINAANADENSKTEEPIDVTVETSAPDTHA